MMLYHGTDARYLDSIMENGLTPRSARKDRKGNWSHTVTSNKDAVYLTDAYGWHFAASASKDTGLILEIDRHSLLPWQLCPDEDFLEQATRKRKGEGFADPSWTMPRRTRFYRKHAKANSQLADASLEFMGTAAYYGTVPWHAVTRWVTIDWHRMNPEPRVRSVDSLVAGINYQILADRHRAFTRWFFDDPVTPEEYVGQDMFHFMEKQHGQVYRGQVSVILGDRSGLRVHAK